MTKILISDENAVSLLTAFVRDNGRFVALLVHRQSMAFEGGNREWTMVPLYRHRLGLSRRIALITGVVDSDMSTASAHVCRIRGTGYIREWRTKCRLRYILLKHIKNIRERNFTQSVKFKLRWSDSGHDVAVYLNGEPWAFVHGGSKQGYSKGIMDLSCSMGNLWDESLFVSTFLPGN